MTFRLVPVFLSIPALVRLDPLNISYNIIRKQNSTIYSLFSQPCYTFSKINNRSFLSLSLCFTQNSTGRKRREERLFLSTILSRARALYMYEHKPAIGIRESGNAKVDLPDRIIQCVLQLDTHTHTHTHTSTQRVGMEKVEDAHALIMKHTHPLSH